MDRLFRARMVVLDTETTGFPGQEWARVIELAAVLVDEDGGELDTWQALIMPDVLDERANGALAVNHITREMLLGQMGTWAASLAFLRWLEGHGRPYLTSFNVDFDRKMVEAMSRHFIGMRWASCIMRRAMEPMHAAGRLALLRGGKPKWPKLSEAADFFGVTVEGDAHRALTDARTAARIAVALRRAELAQESAA